MSALDVGDGVTDERLDVARDENGVDARSLERLDVVARRAGELRDRQLAGRDVVEQFEHPVERLLLVGRLVGHEQQDLRVDVLQGALELVVVPDPDDVLEPQLVAPLHEPCKDVVVVRGEHDRVGCGRVVRSRAVREERQSRVGPQIRAGDRDDDSLGPTLLGAPCVLGVTDVHEHRDPVALRDRLAQPSMRHVRDVRAPLVDGVGSRVVGDVKRVCILGAESTGKSTLAAALAERFGTLWNPEYGRPYTQIGRPAAAPWTSWEFTHIARIHCWYEDFLAKRARGVLFSDTDAFTTAVFHEVYLGTPATGFEELVERPYDLFVVCGLDVPWRHDGIREFEDQRRSMHERYLARARASGSPWLLAEGSLPRRLGAAAVAVDRLLAQLD